MIKNDKTNIDEKYKRFEKIHDKIKFKAFGKVTIRQRRIPKDKLEVVGKDTATELLEAQQKRAQSEIEDIEKTKGGKVRKVWEIKKKVLGGKKTDVEATAIINPKTGNLALSKGEIKKVSLQYTKETLMSNPIEEGVAEEIEQKKQQQQSKKSQYTCPKNMTGSFQNGRTSSKMWGPAFNIVSLPKIACKIVRPFKPDFRERWQVSEFSVSSRKTRSDQGNSRSRLDA